jgi:hypothetical protein
VDGILNLEIIFYFYPDPASSFFNYHKNSLSIQQFIKSMKTRASLIIVLLAGVAFSFSACKKSTTKPSGPVLTAKQVSSQIALNITQTLYSGFGAFSVGQGLNAPGSLGLVKNKNGLRVSSTGDPLCGTIADTTLNYTYSDAGTSASVQGNLKFAFACTSGVLSGFTITDNLAVAESTSSFSIKYKLAEDLTLTAVNPNDENSSVVLNGTLSLGGTYNYTSGANKGSGTQNFAYTFHSVTIDSGGTIDSGSADFQTSGTGSTGVWNFTGTVTFLGDGNAKIVINGATYTVNLQTGQVS